MKIDLSKLPEGTKWIAIDSGGDVYAFDDEPVKIGDLGNEFYSCQDDEMPHSWAEYVGNVHD